MTAVNRTAPQLEALFHDNQHGDISAGDGRDFITSCFGYLATVPPTPNNDRNDSAGIGAFFDLRSRWFNTTDNTEWICYDGTPGFAVWVQQLTTPPTSQTSPVLGTVGWYYPGPFTGSGLPTVGSYTLQDGETFLFDPGTPNVNSGPWVAHTGPWTRPPWYAIGTKFNTMAIVNVRSTLNLIFGSGSPSLFQGSPYAIGGAFTQWTVGVDPILWERTGTGGYLVLGGSNINVSPNQIQPTNLPGSFLVSLISNPSVAGVTFVPSLGAPPGSIFIDNTTNLLTFVDLSGMPQVINVGGGGGGLKPFTFDIDYTDFAGMGTTGHFVFASFPGMTLNSLASSIADIPWNLPGGTITTAVVEYSPDGGLTWPTLLSIFPLGHGTTPVQGFGWNPTGYSTPDWTVPMMFRVTLVGTQPLSTLTAGHSRIFLAGITFP